VRRHRAADAVARQIVRLELERSYEDEAAGLPEHGADTVAPAPV
jgi:hypothetical protein